MNRIQVIKGGMTAEMSFLGKEKQAFKEKAEK